MPADESPKPLTPVVFHILLALAEGPRHGYAISSAVEEASRGSVRMGPGTLYGSLQRMGAAGYVAEASDIESDASHEDRRRYYTLTDSGRSALQKEAARLQHAASLARATGVIG